MNECPVSNEGSNEFELKMTPLRKRAFAWCLALTAVAIAALAATLIYLRGEIPTDPAYVEAKITQIANNRSFDVDGARKYYREEEIVAYQVKTNQAEFDREWLRVVAIVGALYFVLSLGIWATVFRREATIAQ